MDRNSNKINKANKSDSKAESSKQTSWGKVADWYDDVLNKEGSYQKEVILPNLIRLLEIKKGESVIDIACGQGFFARAIHSLGASVLGVDIGKELIEIAKKEKLKDIEFIVSSADNLPINLTNLFDKAIIVLAIQNIKDLNKTISEAYRVLKNNGKLFIVLNHPSFRIPKKSSWGFDNATNSQYRRIDSYMSESENKMDMNPGSSYKDKEFTISFHRPLQVYFKALNKSGFRVGKLEEWISHKESAPGPKAQEENRIRKEIPMFMVIEAIKS
jgi:ubiquinone/menaquinone biosynthesis C-methylase UbiE